MALKKSEFYSSLWASCDELRGGMDAIRQQFLFYAVGTKVSGISKTNIAKLTLPVPKVPEQTAIAEVLTDIDAELAALEQRREKTRALKKSLMQELVTGRTRLV